MALAVDALHEEALRLRMMPAAFVLDALPQMVGELARARGKEVDFGSAGAELTVDRRVLESIKDPLLHLVRNAVDHGIEAPDARERAGKPRRGRVAVSLARLEGRRIELRVEDDGAGIDVTALKAAAIRSRSMSTDAAGTLSDGEAVQLVFASGVSTSPVITDLSGHGLGGAIVREHVERVGGSVRLVSTPGVSTTVCLTVPASVATFSGLLVRAGGLLHLLPIDSVERALRISPSAIGSAGGRSAVRIGDRAVAVAPLRSHPGARGHSTDVRATRPCIVLRAGGERAALLVDEIVGEREVLVKELRPPLVRVRHVAAAGLLGSGELTFILRPASLVRSLDRLAATSSAPAETGPPPLVLVVDDSITTRTMEKNLFEAAGYRVEVAADGVEAWTALRDGALRPRDLRRRHATHERVRARRRASARTRGSPSLPVVLVTALETRDDKERGVAVGANAYVIKSGFDQSKLLEIVRRLA